MATDRPAPRTEDMQALVAGLEAQGEIKTPEAKTPPLAAITHISTDTAEMLLQMAIAGGQVRTEAIAHIEDDLTAQTQTPSYLAGNAPEISFMDRAQVIQERNDHPLYIVTLVKEKIEALKDRWHEWNESLDETAQERNAVTNPAE